VLATFPWVERRLTGDRRNHNLADRPRDAPNRTAFGVAFLSWVFLIFVFGAADRLFVLFGLNYDLQLYVFRIGIWVIPLLLFFITRRICRDLQAADRVERLQEEGEETAEHERGAFASQTAG
jgi:ubiquinol-cytochrome c reductase cytochrome b subunit